MSTKLPFQSRVETLLSRLNITALTERWQDALGDARIPEPLAYWIRESADIVNIVWLSDDALRDITWLTEQKISLLNILPLVSIGAVEVREQEGAAQLMGVPVVGNLIIRIFTGLDEGNLIWVANSAPEKEGLRQFFHHVSRKLERGNRS